MSRFAQSFSDAGIEFEERSRVAGKIVDFYLPESNTAIIILGSEYFCFDNETINARGKMIERLVAGSERRPTAKIMNIRQFNMKDRDKIIQELVEQFKP